MEREQSQATANLCIGETSCVFAFADNLQDVKLLTIVDKLFRCGSGPRFEAEFSSGI